MTVQPYDANVRSVPGLVADADLSDKQYYAVEMSAEMNVDLPSAKGQVVIGVLLNNPDDTEIATVATSGQCRCIAGEGGVTAGDLVATDDDGTAITASAEEYFFGLALSTAVAGSLFVIDLDAKGYVKAA